MSQKVIIFEGLDKSGKSTIAQELSKILNIPYFKFNVWSYFKKDQFKNATYFDQPYLLEFLKQTGTSVIVDRAYPSEVVYAPVFKREHDKEFLNKLDEEHAKLGTIIVICIKKDVSEQDEVIPKEKYDEIIKGYLEFSINSKCKTILLDTSSLDLQSQIMFLINHINKKEKKNDKN